MKNDPLRNLRVASPCPANWAQMSGDERVRYCSLCNLHVYNIAELTQAQAARLISETEGRICGRIYRRADGTVITKDCPVGLRAIRRRVAKITGAAFATAIALSSAVFGQKPSPKDNACKQQVTISRKSTDKDDGAVTGTIVDPQGVFIPGARIKFTEQTSLKSFETTSKDDGSFQIAALSAGTYTIVVESNGFSKIEMREVKFGSKENVNLTAILTPASVTVIVGVIAAESLIDNSARGLTTTMSGDLIRKLPIPE